MTFFVNDEDRLWQDSQQKRGFHFSSPWRYVFFLVLLIILIVGIWYFLFSKSPTLTEKDIPLIQRDENPFKIKSKDQGVPGVNHQDKLIYGRIRNDGSPPPVEHILPDSEPIKMIEQYVPEDINPDATSVSIEDLINMSEEKKKE